MRTIDYYIALDGCDLERALELVDLLGEEATGIKIHALYDKEGPSAVSALKEAGAKQVWVDFKLKDTGRTVEDRAGRITESQADLLTVHASGGIDMMIEALKSEIEIVAITVLTTLSDAEVEIIHGCSPAAAALKLAHLAKLAGVPSMVCSGLEVGALAARPELRGTRLIVPGTRSEGAAALGQKRITTPGAAAVAGASALVLGSQVLKAKDPLAELLRVKQEVRDALKAAEMKDAA